MEISEMDLSCSIHFDENLFLWFVSNFDFQYSLGS